MVSLAIDFGNPAPDAELTSVAQKTLNGLLKNPQNGYCCCKKQKSLENESYMGTFMKDAVTAK
jgi:hypothetical protein